MGNPTDNYDYKFYHEGFFGYSLEENFSYFSLAHILPIILLIGAILFTYKYRAKLASWKGEEIFRFSLAALLILNEGFYYWRLLYVGNGGSSVLDPMITYLPFQVCEWSAYIAAFMLMKKSRHLFDICFYVCLTLGVIPFFTPAVIMYTGPAYARYYQFWIEHTVTFIAVFYMIFVHKMRPTIKSMIKSYVALIVLCIIAYNANQLIGNGANYLYMARPESAPSILDILPPNFMLRLIIMASAITALFGVSYLPWYFKDKKLKDI